MPRTCTRIAVPWHDPEHVFQSVAAAHDGVFWLDSGPDAVTGFSWVGWGVPDDPARVHAASCVGDGDHTAGGLPGPGLGDWVGWRGYEAGARAAGVPVHTDEAAVPDELWLRVEGLVCWDHASGGMWMLGPVEIGSTASATTAKSSQAVRIAAARHRPDEYAALIGRCRRIIRAGDAYQLCLTTRFDVAGPVDPVTAYLALRRAASAHHGGIIRSGGVGLVSASPEQFLGVDGARVATRPIKGTRPRGPDAASDLRLARELRASVKEQAENVMIVDLMRNDLARVCLPATVRVDALLQVETYPTVHQLVSTVSGRLRATCTIGELWRAVFPAGSMTGAPKLSAMTCLHELEQGARGAYAGCFGWVGRAGGMDLAMTIRSILTHPGGAYVGAGGGITWGSDAAAEVAEVGIKARAPLAAVGAALPTGW